MRSSLYHVWFLRKEKQICVRLIAGTKNGHKFLLWICLLKDVYIIICRKQQVLHQLFCLSKKFAGPESKNVFSRNMTLLYNLSIHLSTLVGASSNNYVNFQVQHKLRGILVDRRVETTA